MQAEFFYQGDLEASRGMTKSPFMDRKRPNLPKMQMGFIDAVAIPFFKALEGFLPSLKVCMVNLNDNRQMWDTLRRKKLKESQSANPSEALFDSPTESGRLLSGTKGRKVEPFAEKGGSSHE